MDGSTAVATVLSVVFLVVLFSNDSIFCSGINSSNGSCIESERQALLKLKQDLYDPSNRLASWVGKDCCKWSGVTCHNTTGYVRKLLLGTDYWGTLGGKINPSLVELKQLRYLDLGYSDFEGSQFPKFLGSLRRLVYLNLSYCKCDGGIPHQLGNLTNLLYLDLNGAAGHAKSLHWLSQVSSLRYLDMGWVDLGEASAHWLQVTNSLPSLIVLRLRHCKLNFSTTPPLYHVNFSSLALLDLSECYYMESDSNIPKWVFSLTSLASLTLSWNGYGGVIPEGIQNMTSLVHLDLSENNFNRSIPSWLFELSRLEFLNLANNRLSSTITGDVTNLTSLVHLDLSGGNFNSSIPSWLFGLSRLEFLRLSGNGVHTIPGDIRNLTSIIQLDLSYNKFEGKLPSLMGTQLCWLKILDLCSNNWNQLVSEVLDSLSGCVSDTLESLDIYNGSVYGPLTNQIGKFKSLTSLRLSGNSISGPIPISLGNLSSLRYLSLSNNHFNGSLPEYFGQFAELISLYIYDNLLEGVVSEVHFANTTKLSYLWAYGNALTLKVCRDWIPPFQLDALGMESWHLGPKFPLWLRTQKNLRVLRIPGTGLDDVLPSWICDSFELEYLNLSHNHLHGRIGNILPKIVHRTSRSISLDLSNNEFSGSISQFLCRRPGGATNIDSLKLSQNQLSGNIPNCWSNWKQLQFVDLSYNKFNGSIPSSLGSLTFLVELNLRNNNLSGEIFLALHNCTELIILDLSENNFGGVIPAWIGARLFKLRVLRLHSNNFSGRISDGLCALDSLQILDFSCNNLSGYIPKCFNNFSVMALKDSSYYGLFEYTKNGMRYIFEEEVSLVIKGQEVAYSKNVARLVTCIDLSSNFLSGHIPVEITSLSITSLSLNLSNNLLTGGIPGEIGKMGELESIDFSMNKLSGEIPPSLSNLSFLSVLRLSYNNLTGKIPSGTQLQSLTESSCIGNSLCGPPLAQNCTLPVERNNRRNEEDDDEGNFSRPFCMAMGVGFAIGFWGVCGFLVLNRTWRHTCFQLLDSMQDRIYVYSKLKVRWFHEKLRNFRHKYQ